MVAPKEFKESLIKEFPNVDLSLNKQFDIEKINYFYMQVAGQGGVNCREWILKSLPALRGIESLSEDERLEKVEAYVDDFYGKNEDRLEEIVVKTQKEWDEYSPAFYEATTKIFKGLNWPEGEYHGFVTISSPCPRNLENKSFQFPDKSMEARFSVIAHEMLHFIFFEYVRKRYTPQLEQINGEKNDAIIKWKISNSFVGSFRGI